MATPYGRGSEWRRWDLHVHAPGTAREDQFGGWDEYLDAVEVADPAIVVMGVTDYARINTYKEFKAHQDVGRMTNIVMAFPNIEFRLSPETKNSKGINLHLLISPDDSDHIDRIDEALMRLKITRNETDISCTRAGLIRLGGISKPHLRANAAAAYSEGVNQFKIDLDIFREWLESEKWLRSNALVAVQAGSEDGVSGLVDGGYATTRKEIYRFADIIFSANPAEREAWLGRGGIRPAEFPHLRGHKAVVQGSDAHSIGRLFQHAKDRYCWIKSDPTFDGLRQILYEPEDRTWMGDAFPTSQDDRPVIESITVSNSNQWFEKDRQILLNPGLVAIVGLKGSGKTALADLIAFGCGAALDGDNSFVARAQDHLSGLSTVLRWNDGESDTARLPDQPGDGHRATVKYLSQKFVDRLCDGDALGDDLQREVEDVIFQHLDFDAQMGCEDFRALREFRTEVIRETRQDLDTQIREASREIAGMDERRAAIQAKSVRRAQLPILLSALAKSLPRIDNEASKLKLQELAKLRDRKQTIEQNIAGLRATFQKIVDIERRLASKIAEVDAFWQTKQATLKSLGFSAADIAKLAPAWTAAPALFRARRDAVEKQITTATGRASQSSQETAAGIEAAIKRLESDLDIDKTKKGKIANNTLQRQTLTKEKRRLTADAEWSEKSYKGERQEASDRRLELYLSYFALLEEEKGVLQELYEPFKTALTAQGAQEQKLDVICRVNVDLAGWIARGAELFDQRKTGRFRYEEIEKIAKFTLQRAWVSCDAAKVRAGIEKCLGQIKETHALKNQLKSGFRPKDVAEWLFGVDHIDVTHAIRYEGKDLRLLSPGTKGIVLLILYLAVDRFDNRPLIVDQPDENLDNQSTYEILREYFRHAKKRRQIIIITHNPNLVVNTDAEQVIVAESELRSNGLPTISYTCGSLECAEGDGVLGTSIREAVCRIMEGGKDAFRQREHRYGKVLDA